MSLTYDPTKPNPPDDPADDVTAMQTNAASIASIWGIDHYSFGSAINGLHKQVTFAGNNTPSLPTAYPTLFTSIVNALPQLFFYSGDASQTSSQYQLNQGVLTKGGSTFLFGGLILKWGFVDVAAGNTDVVFATNCGSAFPNNGFAVILQPYNSGSANVANNYAYAYDVTTTKFSCLATQRTSLTSAAQRIYFIAIGN